MKFIKALFSLLFPTKQEPVPVLNTPVPPIIPLSIFEENPPKYLWDTISNTRHSIRLIADEEGLSLNQKNMLCDICRCESGYNIHAKLVNSPTSIDRGLFQWNNKYHPEITDEIAEDPEKNTRLACKAVKNNQARVFWSASFHCWNAGNKYD